MMVQRSSAGTEGPLLPCPFCGNEHIMLWAGFGTQAEIECSDCDCDRAVQVRDVPGCKDAKWDDKTFRFDEPTILLTNRYLALEWNERSGGVSPQQSDDDLAREIHRVAGCQVGSDRTNKLIAWYRSKIAVMSPPVMIAQNAEFYNAATAANTEREDGRQGGTVGMHSHSRRRQSSSMPS